MIHCGHQPDDISVEDTLDFWVCIQAGLFGPHADYMQSLAVISSVETLNANTISLHSKKRGKDPRKPRQIFPNWMDFVEYVDSDDEEYIMKRNMEALDGRL